MKQMRKRNLDFCGREGLLSAKDKMQMKSFSYKERPRFRIHQFDMSLQAFFIADIPGMNDKSRLFIPGIVTHIIHPVCMVFRIKYLCISNMNIPVGAVFTNPSTVRDQTEIITGLFLFYFMIMTVKCFIPRRSGLMCLWKALWQ